MIISETKDFGEILESLTGYMDIAILGCGRCATSCQTGGEKQVGEMSEILGNQGFNIVHAEVVEAQCDERLSKKALKKTNGAQAILSMACGSGTSALGDLTDLPVVASNNTLFLGVMKRIGDYTERCSMCGDCILTETMGVCVTTRCAKGLRNGPCGGSQDGKCEVDGERDCAWAIVIDRLRKAKRLNELGRIRRPRTTFKDPRPRSRK